MHHRLPPILLHRLTIKPTPNTLPLIAIHHFHSTRHHPLENHYTILESTPSSSHAHLKKKFYALSKKHHPDLHPDDPTSSSQRFIRISTAWAVLGNEAKRSQYDRELFRRDPSLFGTNGDTNSTGHGARGGPMPAGSHSSAQTGAAWGARPASGLSRRRGAFRGPPESFYRSGGWGVHGEKRQAASEGAEEAARRAADSFATGQGREYADAEVPHFDRQGHFRRQESVEEALKRRRSVWAERRAAEREEEDSGTWARIGIVSTALIVTGLVSVVWDWRSEKKKR